MLSPELTIGNACFRLSIFASATLPSHGLYPRNTLRSRYCCASSWRKFLKCKSKVDLDLPGRMHSRAAAARYYAALQNALVSTPPSAPFLHRVRSGRPRRNSHPQDSTNLYHRMEICIVTCRLHETSLCPASLDISMV